MPSSHSLEVKPRVDVVGGVYRERCRLPSNPIAMRLGAVVDELLR
ncbi:MAG TPA: hypothetical protein VHZ55_01770 [Bryobacteraceae bacterium]|nr:hypothetical protein [Bryobacteraceae bacterium]